jgi:hypothetical protein
MGSAPKHIALALLLCVSAARAFPLYTATNGSTVLASAFGGDVVLQPSFGGASHSMFPRPSPSADAPRSPRPGSVTARALLDAQGGVGLNGTILTGDLITSLGSLVPRLCSTQHRLG